MFKIVASAAMLSAVWISVASAQAPAVSGPSSPPAVKAPEPGSPLNPQTDAGLAKEGPDGSTVMVPAVPCSKFARESDATTTCVGIPGPIRRAGQPVYPSDTTTGLNR